MKTHKPNRNPSDTGGFRRKRMGSEDKETLESNTCTNQMQFLFSSDPQHQNPTPRIIYFGSMSLTVVVII